MLLQLQCVLYVGLICDLMIFVYCVNMPMEIKMSLLMGIISPYFLHFVQHHYSHISYDMLIVPPMKFLDSSGHLHCACRPQLWSYSLYCINILAGTYNRPTARKCTVVIFSPYICMSFSITSLIPTDIFWLHYVQAVSLRFITISLSQGFFFFLFILGCFSCLFFFPPLQTKVAPRGGDTHRKHGLERGHYFLCVKFITQAVL